MKEIEIVRRRLSEQRLGDDRFDQPVEAVRWLGAVQAQEFAEAKWSLAERTRRCTDTDVEASFTRGEIIRTHLLRPTWHFVAREDVRWLLRLTRPRVHALNRYWYRRFELDAEVFARGHHVIAEALRDGETKTRKQLAEHLATAGIEADGLRLGYLLMHAELEELICSGPRQGKQQTYSLLDYRVPNTTSDALTRDAALDELVLRYFRSHGPATIRDFVAWSSLTATDAKQALERVAVDLERQEDKAGTA